MKPLYGTPVILPHIGKSDHNAVLCNPSPDHSALGSKPQTSTTRVNGHNEKALFADALMNIPWEPLYRMQSCNGQFMYLQQNLTDLLDTFLPKKTVTKFSSDKPWITPKYKDLIQQRQLALHRGEHEEYRRLRNLINRLTRKLRSSYYTNKVSNLSANDSRSWWSNINTLMGRKQENNALVNLANKLFALCLEKARLIIGRIIWIIIVITGGELHGFCISEISIDSEK